MDGLAVQEVDHGDDLEGHRRHGRQERRAHSWSMNGSTGAGLPAGRLPASWAAEGRAMRRAIAADFASLPGEPVRVIVTSDARLPDEPGPWTIARIAPGEDTGRLR